MSNAARYDTDAVFSVTILYPLSLIIGNQFMYTQKNDNDKSFKKKFFFYPFVLYSYIHDIHIH